MGLPRNIRHRLGLVIAAITLSACAHGSAASGALVERDNAPPCTGTPDEATGGPDSDFARRVDIGGRSLFVACRGAGQPTVVMETGFSDPGAVWGRDLIRRVAVETRVCVYDRANLGYSDDRATPADSGTVSLDLHALLGVAHIVPPYVMVGHSVGGMHVRVYDHKYPGEVVGMVLVDSSHSDQFVRAQQRLSADDWVTMWRGVREAYEDPAREPSSWERSSALARLAGSLGSRPLHVLSHDPEAQPKCHGDDCLSAEGHETWERLWEELQAELALLSSRSRHIVARGSGHYIQAQNPDLVVEAIGQVVRDVR